MSPDYRKLIRVALDNNLTAEAVADLLTAVRPSPPRFRPLVWRLYWRERS